MHVKEIYVIFIHLFDSGILLIIDLNKKKRKKRGGGILFVNYYLETNPGLSFLLKVQSCVFISNFHHSPSSPPKRYKIVSLIIN
jgi:hypothetical protein